MIEMTGFILKGLSWLVGASTIVCVASFFYAIIFSIMERNSDKSGESLLSLMSASFLSAIVLGVVFTIVYVVHFNLVEHKQEQFIEKVLLEGESYELFEKTQPETEKENQDIVVLITKDRVLRLEISNHMTGDTFEYEMEDITNKGVKE